MSTNKLFTKRRIGVCGSSKGLPYAAVPFCQAIGERLAAERFAVIVSGGALKRSSVPDDDFAADWHIVSAAKKVIEANLDRSDALEAVGDRIETILAETDGKDFFREGTVRYPRGRTSEARRFSFVRDVDALIAVAGRGGTGQELALAHELEKPVLPVPTFGGASQAFWSAYRADMIRNLRIDERRALRWEASADANPEDLRTLATEMVTALLESIPRRCFVIMPFQEDYSALYDFVIRPAIEMAGDRPIRLDRAAVPGDVIRQIDDGLAACEYAIVVLDGLRPNVLYELGLAHGRGKPTVLIGQKRQLESEARVPFDITTQHRLEYEVLDASLPKRLEEAIRALWVRR